MIGGQCLDSLRFIYIHYIRVKLKLKTLQFIGVFSCLVLFLFFLFLFFARSSFWLGSSGFSAFFTLFFFLLTSNFNLTEVNRSSSCFHGLNFFFGQSGGGFGNQTLSVRTGNSNSSRNN